MHCVHLLVLTILLWVEVAYFPIVLPIVRIRRNAHNAGVGVQQSPECRKIHVEVRGNNYII